MQVLDNIYARVKMYAFMGPVKFFSISKAQHSKQILHIGAHEGQELNAYSMLGFKDIFWVEAIPEVFERLKNRVGESNCASALLWSSSGEKLKFNVANNEVSSSVFSFTDKTPWDNVRMVREIELQTSTLDTLILKGILREDFLDGALLVLDVQGAEMEVLKGSLESILLFQAVSVEVSRKHFYQGSAKYKSIHLFLKSHGYKKIAEWIDPKMGHGDALYVAKSVSVGFKSLLIGRCISFFHFLYLLFRALERRDLIKLTTL
jgi:FkbM family methyltransferase